jgi:choline dehydrogenase
MPVLAITEDYPKNSLVDWDLLSAPQVSANGRRIHYAQGKTLGGSSALNTMAYHRGTTGAYQRWADQVGDQSYTFDRMLPYFKRTATLTPPNLEKRKAPNATVLYDAGAFDTRTGGPLQVSWANWVDPTQSWLARALQAIGQQLSPSGLNSGIVEGGAWVPTTIDPNHAVRSTSKSSYLEAAMRDPKSRLTVHLHSQVSKILFVSNKKITGVTILSGGKTFLVTAKKEIVLSAGVFHSPQLLHLSGIGPAAMLRSQSIAVVSDLAAVGQNLQDQIFFNVLRGITVPNTGTYIATPKQQVLAVQQYVRNATGPYSSAGGYLSFEKLPAASRKTLSARTSELLAGYPSDWPEIEYIASGFPGGFLNLTTVGAISGTLLTPTSKGNVSINSASVRDPPVINLNWLSDPADGEVLVAAFKRVRQAWNSSAIAGIIAGPEITPGDAVTTDAQILDFIRSAVQPIWHASSTCAMGKTGDMNAVVDTKARVFGVKGLRVVDASAIPFSLPGHPQSTVYALAEKIAEDILGTR